MPLITTTPFKPPRFAVDELTIVYDHFGNGNGVGLRKINIATGGSFASLISDDLTWFTGVDSDISSDATYYPANNSVVFIDRNGLEEVYEIELNGTLLNSYDASPSSLQEFSSVAWEPGSNMFILSHLLGAGANGEWFSSSTVAGISSHGYPVHSADLFNNPVTATVEGMAHDTVNGTMWITESNTYTISEVDLTTGLVVSSFPISNTEWGFRAPEGILVKNDEIILVAPGSPSRVAKYTRTGTTIELPTILGGINFGGSVGLIG